MLTVHRRCCRNSPQYYARAECVAAWCGCWFRCLGRGVRVALGAVCRCTSVAQVLRWCGVCVPSVGRQYTELTNTHEFAFVAGKVQRAGCWGEQCDCSVMVRLQVDR